MFPATHFLHISYLILRVFFNQSYFLVITVHSIITPRTSPNADTITTIFQPNSNGDLELLLPPEIENDGKRQFVKNCHIYLSMVSHTILNSPQMNQLQIYQIIFLGV
jgi:hypothetical protein